uniref:Putative cyclin b n=1 Tax=Lutzomyia longipalpis TaxID=7200 RepID=A0A1B0CCW3_LUTLO
MGNFENEGDCQALSTTLKEAQRKIPLHLKNVKPRVNTFWKKGELQDKIDRAIIKRSEVIKLAGKKKNLAISKPFVARKVPNLEKGTPLTQLEPDHQIERSAVEEFETDAPEWYSYYLLSDVIDIDAGYDNSLIHMTEYVRDIFSYLVELEKKFPIERQNMRISLHMRSVLVNWINAVHYDFRLVPETYYLSVALIDRYLQQRKNFSRKFLQLLGITALLLASKYEETKPPSIHEFVNITDNSYTAHEVRLMEIKLLHYVEFNLNRPLPTHFLRRFSKAANATENIHGAANYFLELISLEYLMVHLRPSLMAAASIYLALRLLCPNEDGSSVWTSILENYTNYTEGEVLKVAKDVALLVIEAPDSTYQAIFSKYQNEKLGGISVLPEMSQGIIKKIINSSIQSSS